MQEQLKRKEGISNREWIFRRMYSTTVSGSGKTLMYFEGCASHLGCTVTLRGGTENELRKVSVMLTICFLYFQCFGCHVSKWLPDKTITIQTWLEIPNTFGEMIVNSFRWSTSFSSWSTSRIIPSWRFPSWWTSSRCPLRPRTRRRSPWTIPPGPPRPRREKP